MVSSLAPGASDTFHVQLDTSITGTKTCDITFTNNDGNENPFIFFYYDAVHATPHSFPTRRSSDLILDGDTTPSGNDQTDFGSVGQGGAAVVHTFTVRN